MNSIQIEVTGTDLEIVTINLSAAEVAAQYQRCKDQAKEIKDFEKKMKDTEQSLKYRQDSEAEKASEIEQANMLLTALGIQEKTVNEQEYYRKPLPVATRIALYIAHRNTPLSANYLCK